MLAALGGAAAAWPLAARAQQAPKMLRVGTVSAQPRSASVWMAFEQRMVELGYEQGKNFALEIVPAASTQGFERGYRELAARNIDIVLASGPEIALKSALAAGRSLPIVMIAIEYDLARQDFDLRKATPASVLAKAGPGIRFNEHIEGDGPTVFDHSCKLGLEGIVSKRLGSPYRSGRSRDWVTGSG
ncbi:MAG TPA: hypothetical protein VM910_11840 [Bradyrhizobium sp.]|nr:hypothetical protein [Bradyrhizobium sp.]